MPKTYGSIVSEIKHLVRGAIKDWEEKNYGGVDKSMHWAYGKMSTLTQKEFYDKFVKKYPATFDLINNYAIEWTKSMVNDAEIELSGRRGI